MKNVASDDELMHLSAPELRIILEAGEDVHGAERIAKAREAMQAHNHRVTGRWVKALGLKIAIIAILICGLVSYFLFGKNNGM